MIASRRSDKEPGILTMPVRWQSSHKAENAKSTLSLVSSIFRIAFNDIIVDIQSTISSNNNLRRQKEPISRAGADEGQIARADNQGTCATHALLCTTHPCSTLTNFDKYTALPRPLRPLVARSSSNHIASSSILGNLSLVTSLTGPKPHLPCHDTMQTPNFSNNQSVDFEYDMGQSFEDGYTMEAAVRQYEEENPCLGNAQLEPANHGVG